MRTRTCAGESTGLSEIGAGLDEEVSFLAWELRPAVLDDLGLVVAADNYVTEWSKHFEIPAEFQSTGLRKSRLDPETETNLYRIIQEALNNAYKHAKASQASVSLEKRQKNVVLIIEDDGIGFDPKQEERVTKSGRGLGLVGIRERAAIVGGSVEIESTPGKGTTIYVRVPFQPACRGGGRMVTKTRILLAEDHKTVREGIKLLVNAQPDMEVVGEAGDGEAALKKVRELDAGPDHYGHLDAGNERSESHEKAEEVQPDVKILTLTRHTDDGYLQQLIGAGANGYVLKQSAPTELINAIRSVRDGNAYLDPALTEKVMGGYVSKAAFQTRREKAGLDRPGIRGAAPDRLGLQQQGDREPARPECQDHRSAQGERDAQARYHAAGSTSSGMLFCRAGCRTTSSVILASLDFGFRISVCFSVTAPIVTSPSA